MKAICRNIKNTQKYKENMKKYEGITLSIIYIGRGTWKNFELLPLLAGGGVFAKCEFGGAYAKEKT